MVAADNAITMRNWAQTGGQNQDIEVIYLSPSWWWEQRDKRSDQYALLMNPTAVILISICYIIFVTWIGPTVMRNREPYSLKIPLLVYNICQVIINLYIVLEASDAGWGRHYSWICQNVEAGNEEGSTAMRMVAITYVYFINKYIEFADTIFFVARKKNNQLTLLHVYHHAIMPIYAWIQMRWLPGGHEILVGVMNSFVHVVMYSYYLLSALGPKMQRYLWWKKYLTVLQLVQFCLAIVHTLIVATGIVQCGYPWLNCAGTFVFIQAPFLYLFLEFYRKSYSTKHYKPSSAKKAGETKTN